MNLIKTSKILFTIYIIFIISVKVVSLISFWLLAIFGLYYTFKEKINPFKMEYAKYAAILPLTYFLTMFISNILSTMPENKFNALARVLYLFFAPFIVVIIYKINFSFEKFIKIIKISTILSCIIILIQFIYNNFSINTDYIGMYNRNIYADILVYLSMLSIVNIFKENKKTAMLSILTFLLGVIAIILSGARGSLLSLVIVFIIFIFINLMLNKKYKIQTIISIVIFSLFIGIIYYKTDLIKDRVNIAKHQIINWEKNKDQTSSVALRLVMWTNGIKAFKDKPILGYGYHNAIPAISKYIESNNTKNVLKHHWQLHNEIIDTSVNTGIVGLLALLSLYFIPFIIFLKNLNLYKEIALSGIILMSGTFFMGLTHQFLGNEYKQSMFVILLSFILVKLYQKKRYQQ